MAVFEVESWRVAQGKDKEHEEAMRGWLKWVGDHRNLFGEWKSVRYFSKKIAGQETGRHFVVWEYDSLTAFETYKKRRHNYTGAYEEYKKNDPYYKDVFIHAEVHIEVWEDMERDLWLE